ncbi:asparagine synthase [Clostridium sp. JNZ J1-5]
MREGVIPTALGTVVTGAGATMVMVGMAPMVAAGVVGFGLAHIVLGSIDLVEHRRGGKFSKFK